MNFGKAEIVFFSIAGILALVLFFTRPPAAQAEMDPAAEAAGNLFMGESASASRRNTADGSGRSGRSGPGRSLFDSDLFRERGGHIDDEAREIGDDPRYGIIDSVSENNPINPQTGEQYTDYMMEQFDALRERFPGNSIIPRRMAPEEREQEEQQRREIFQIQSEMIRNQASREEVMRYYEYQTTSLRDRLEILDYAMETQADRMDENMRSQFEEVLEQTRSQLENYEQERERRLEQAPED